MVAIHHGSQQNATVSALTPAQEIALCALVAGKTVTAAAAEAGVDRTTVHRWFRELPTFQIELDRRRQQIRDAVQDRLLGMAHKAADALEGALEDGDAKSALALLRGLGLMPDSPAVSVSVTNQHDATAFTPMPEPTTHAGVDRELAELFGDPELQEWLQSNLATVESAN